MFLYFTDYMQSAVGWTHTGGLQLRAIKREDSGVVTSVINEPNRCLFP